MTKAEALVAIRRLEKFGWSRPELLYWYGEAMQHWRRKEIHAIAAVGPDGGRRRFNSVEAVERLITTGQ